MRLVLLGCFVGLLALVGCASSGSGDTTTGAAESAAALAKKSEGSPGLNPRDQAVIDKAQGPGGGAMSMKKKGSP